MMISIVDIMIIEMVVLLLVIIVIQRKRYHKNIYDDKNENKISMIIMVIAVKMILVSLSIPLK